LNEGASQDDSLDSKDEIAQNSLENSAQKSVTNQEEMTKKREEFQALRDSVNVMNQERQEVMTQDVRAIRARMTEVQRLLNGPLGRIQDILEYPERADHNFERLWEIAGRTTERFEVSKRYTKDMEAHLGEQLAETSKRIEGTLEAQREQL